MNLFLGRCPYCGDDNSQQCGTNTVPALCLHGESGALCVICDACGNEYPLEVQESS